MNNKQIALPILFAGIVAMIFSGATNSVNGQMLLSNEQKQYIQQQVNPPFTATDTDFLKFMQLMAYYEQIFGKDYVTKVYKNYYDDDDDDDDDDDNDHDHDKHKKKWWKDRDHKDGKDKKEWWEKEKAAREDHRCEEPGTKGCGGGNDKDDDDNKDEEDSDNDDVSKDNDSDEEDNDSDSDNEDSGGDDDSDSGDDGDDGGDSGDSGGDGGDGDDN